VGSTSTPPPLHHRQGFNQESTGEQELNAQGGPEGDGGHGWSAQGAAGRPLLPPRCDSGSRARAPLPSRGIAAQVPRVASTTS
jgi:hypothetical protein